MRQVGEGLIDQLESSKLRAKALSTASAAQDRGRRGHRPAHPSYCCVRAKAAITAPLQEAIGGFFSADPRALGMNHF